MNKKPTDMHDKVFTGAATGHKGRREKWQIKKNKGK